MRQNRETKKTMGLFIFGELLWGSPKSERRAVSSPVRPAAQKLPTLLNHHFLKPQLPFSVRRRRRRRRNRNRKTKKPERDDLGKKAAASETAFRRMSKTLSFEAISLANSYPTANRLQLTRDSPTDVFSAYESPCGSNATHHHSPPSVPIVSSAAAAAAHCTNNSTGCAPPTALPPFPAVFTSSRTTCLTAPLPPLAVSPADGTRTEGDSFLPESQFRLRNGASALLRCSGQIPIKVQAGMHACTSKVAQTEPLYESRNRTQTAELVSFFKSSMNLKGTSSSSLFGCKKR